MSYFEWLRAHVGKDPVILVYATAIIRDSGGRVLFQRRGDFPDWGLPGGLLEPGETIRAALVREALEETGYEVVAERFTGLYSSPEYTVTYPNGDVAQQVTACFECRILGGDGRPDGSESLEQRFFEKRSEPPVFPWYRAMLDDVARTGTRFDAGTRSGPNPYPEGIIRRLRAKVGHAPILMPCATAIVQDAEGRLLLHRRGDSGLWALPAGAMEVGERIDLTVTREVEEETGLTVRPRRLTGFYTGPEQHTVYPNGDEAWLAVAAFQCDIEGGTLQPDGDESLEVAFFAPHELPLEHTPWGPRTLRRIADAMRGSAEAVAV